MHHRTKVSQSEANSVPVFIARFSGTENVTYIYVVYVSIRTTQKKQYKPSRCQNRLHLAMADFMIFGGFKTHASLFEHRRPPGPLLINQHYCSSTGGKAHSEGWMMTWSCHFGQSPRKIDFLIGTTKLQFSEDDKHQDRPYTVYTMYTVYTLCIPPCGNSSLGHLQAPALCMAHHTWHPVGESGAARFGSTSTMDQ